MEELGASAGLLLGAVLLVAGLGKLHDPSAFRAAVGVLVGRGAKAVAAAVVCAELLLGAALVTGTAARPAAAAALILLALFCAALLRLRALDGDADCGCFGEPTDDADGGTAAGLARNALLAVAAVTVLATPPAQAIWSQPAQTAVGEATLALGLFCVWTLGRAGARLVAVQARG